MAIEKCEKECNMLENMLVQGFCPLKMKVIQFPNGFGLKTDLSLICHNGTLTCHTLEIIYFFNKAVLLNFKKGQLKVKLKQNK